MSWFGGLVQESPDALKQKEYGRLNPTKPPDLHWTTTYARSQWVDKPVNVKDFPNLTYQDEIQLNGFKRKSQRIGPFQKRYEIMSFGLPIFRAPESIILEDGTVVPVVCQCRDIPKFMRDSKGGLIVNNTLQYLAENGVACWDDDSRPIFDPLGSDNYYIRINPSEMAVYLVSKDPWSNAMGWGKWLTGTAGSSTKVTLGPFSFGRQRSLRKKQKNRRTRRRHRNKHN